MRLINEELYQNFISSLENNQSKALLRGFSGSYISSWMDCGFQNLDCFMLSQEEFTECLRIRLLIPTFTHRSPTQCFIRECRKCNITNDPFHAITCKGNAQYTKDRHDLIKKLLIVLIKKCRPYATVLQEQTVGQRSNGTSAITDILISEGSSFSHLDVTIKSPTSDQALSKGSHSCQYIAASLGEEIKVKSYSTLPPTVSNSLIPFSLECTGLLGREAKKFLRGLKAPEDCPAAISYFRMNVSRILAKTQAIMMIHTRRKGVDSSFY
jgi:hypothetical protein